MNPDRIQVFIISQLPVFRQGIEYALAFYKDLSLFGSNELDEYLLSTVDDNPPDIAVLDMDAVDNGGMVIVRQLKLCLPNIGIVAMTSRFNEVQIFQALKTQAAACLGKDVTTDTLVDTIRRVATGEYPINENLFTHPILADQVLLQFRDLARQIVAKPFMAQLTPRESLVLDHLAQGFLPKQIADKLGIGEQSLKNHITSILRKFSANVRIEAVVVAMKQCLLSIR